MKKFARLRKTYGVVVAGILLGVGSIVSTSAVTYANTVPDPAPADEQISVATDRTTDPVDGSGEKAPEPEETEAPAEVFDPEETEMSAEDVDPEGAEALDDESEVVELNEITPEGEDVAIAPFATAIDCDPAKIFAVTEGGSVFSVNEAGGTPTKIDDGWYNLYTKWRPSYSGTESPSVDGDWGTGVNGLAIAEDGTMYAYARGYVKRSDLGKNYNLRIRMLVKEPGGAWKWLDGAGNTGAGQQTYGVAYEARAGAMDKDWDLPVTGSIDPKSGNYVWGEFEGSNFIIREINVNPNSPDFQKSYVSGMVNVGITGDQINGDIAFDSAGNLYIVAQSGKKMSITTVTAPDREANREQFNDYRSRPSKKTPGSTVKVDYSSQVNGIAVGESGDLYVSTKEKIFPVSPLTGKMGAAIAAKPYTRNITDLSSCAKNSPTTVTLQKDLKDEGKSDDEFNLSVSYANNELTSTTAKTRVPNSTVLEETTAPAWVSTGAVLTLKETGANLSRYASNLRCTIDGGADVPVTGGTNGTGTVTIPAEAAGKNVTCTFTNTPRESEPTSCDASLVYAVSQQGLIGTLPADAENSSFSVLDQSAKGLRDSMTKPTGTTWTWTNDGINALGIDKDTGRMYALGVGSSTSGSSVQVRVRLMATDENGVWNWVELPSDQSYPNGYYKSTLTQGAVSAQAGAVNPITGDYYFGGWGESGTAINTDSRNMLIFKYDPKTNTVTDVGKVTATGSETASYANGDFAFDAAGNLQIIRGAGGKTSFTITTVTAADLASPSGTVNPKTIKSSTSKQQNVPGAGSVNGIAVLSDGSFALSTTQGGVGPSRVWRVDPMTLAQIGPNLTSTGEGLAVVSDLSSCAEPTTLSVQKDVVGRVNPTDQFTLNLGPDGGAVARTVDTTGANNDIQEQKIPATPVLVDGKYSVTEAAKGTNADLSKYTSSLSCTIDGTDEDLVSDATTGGVLTVPAAAAGKNITCTFTNTPKPEGPTATITLTKVDKDNLDDEGNPLLLPGAKFQLWEDVDGDGVLNPTVDKKVGGIRTSPANGIIKWTDLDPNKKYLVQEVSAPEGYDLPSPSVWKPDFDKAVLSPTGDPALPAGMIPIMPQLQQFLLVGTSASAQPTINIQSSEELGKFSSVPWSRVDSKAKSPWPVTGAAPMLAGTDYSGNVAFSRGSSKLFSSNNINVYADRGIVSKGTSANNDNNNSKWYPPAGGNTPISGNTSPVYKQDATGMSALQTELEGLKTFVQGKTTECTAAWSGTPRTFNVDTCDTNNDGIAVIKLTTAELQNGQYLIKGSGSVFPIFKIDSGTFKLNNASMSISTGLREAFGGMGAMFVQLGTSDDPFQLSNSLINGVGMYDLRMTGDKKFQMSNVQGCGQFVGQVLDFSDVSLRRCAQGPSALMTVGNTKSPEKGKLTLIKVVDNGEAGTAEPDDFKLTAGITGESKSPFVSGDDQIVDVGEYEIGETLLPGYAFTDVKCEGGELTENEDAVNGTDVTAGTVVVAKDSDVTCTLTNKYQTGTVIWEKVDKSDPAQNLAGSQWELQGPSGPSAGTYTITDCIEDPCIAAPYEDQDPAPGKFELVDLPLGNYTLTETKAPAGYVLDDTPRPVALVIGSDGVVKVDLGKIENEQADGPNLPLTGGMSSVMFAFLGGGLFGAAVLGAKALRKKGAGVHAE